MNKAIPNSNDAYLPSKALKAGCEAIYIPDEDDNSPGQWTFHQNYNQGIRTLILCWYPGIIWERLSLPWLVVRSDIHHSNAPMKPFSRQVTNAETYLRDFHPGAQIPRNLLKEHLRASIKESDRNSNPYQGELLGLGITRITRDAAAGRKQTRRRHEFFVAFPSGKMRSYISITQSWAPVNIRCSANTVEDEG